MVLYKKHPFDYFLPPDSEQICIEFHEQKAGQFAVESVTLSILICIQLYIYK